MKNKIFVSYWVRTFSSVHELENDFFDNAVITSNTLNKIYFNLPESDEINIECIEDIKTLESYLSNIHKCKYKKPNSYVYEVQIKIINWKIL